MKATVYDILNDRDNFVSEVQQKSFQRYYEFEWEKHVEKWAGHITSKIMHFGCTTSQRAESGHKILKRGMSTVQPLNLAINCLVANLEDFEQNYRALELKERNTVDVLVATDLRFANLIGKVSHRAISALYQEYERDDIDVINDICTCTNPIVFNIPCAHFLKRLNHSQLKVSDVPRRWMLNTFLYEAKEDQSEADSCLSSNDEEKPWMKYVKGLTQAFLALEANNMMVESNKLMSTMEEILK
ncbi:hypothetical protein ABG067_008090, partial [Albugo candida]